MSRRCMPLLVLNLGCEMLYVLHERLVAQSVPSDKAAEVLVGIYSALFAQDFVDNLFRPQDLCPSSNLRAIFERLAHASVMRLNARSMGKLLDLMLMTTKYHLQACRHPRELLGVSLNHVDGARSLLEGMLKAAAAVSAVDDAANTAAKKKKNKSKDSEILGLVDATRSLLLTNYAGLTDGQWFMTLQSLSGLLQDRHTKVAMFMQLGLQREDGLFFVPTQGLTPLGTAVPGVITCVIFF